MAIVETGEDWYDQPTECDAEFYEKNREEIEDFRKLFFELNINSEQRKKLTEAPPANPPKGKKRHINKEEREDRENSRDYLRRIQKWMTPEAAQQIRSFIDNTEDEQWKERIWCNPDLYAARCCHRRQCDIHAL